jgi:hypothetical protein
MSLRGQRVKIPRWVHAGPCVVYLEVDAVIPEADPSEPCLEPATVRLLDQIQGLAEAGEIAQLQRYGTVYIRQSA